MLLFILWERHLSSTPFVVSIHHMLLFILQRQYRLRDGFMFQYITCYSLSSFPILRSFPLLVSIHHMLLFILKLEAVAGVLLRFNTSHVTLYHSDRAFIRPYLYVSIHHMLLFINRKVKRIIPQDHCFNTSHVTLYQINDYLRIKKYWFQYITCYSLSYDVYIVCL